MKDLEHFNTTLELMLSSKSALNVKTYAFISRRMKDDCFCDRLSFSHGPDIDKLINLIYEFNYIVREDKKSCIIIFCRPDSISKVLELMDILSDR